MNTCSKIHQIATAADQLASKINGNSSASGQKFLCHRCGPQYRGYFPGVTLFIKMTYTWKLRSVSLQVYGRVGISLVEVDLKYMKG